MKKEELIGVIMLVAALSGAVLFFYTDGPAPVTGVQLKAENVVEVQTETASQTMEISRLRGWMIERGYEKPTIYDALESAQKQQQAYRIGQKSTRPDKQAVLWTARAIYSETKRMKDMEYIGWVIRNRMEGSDFPSAARKVVLQHKQFSAFNKGNPRRKKLMEMDIPTPNTYFRRAYRMAKYVLSAPQKDNPMAEGKEVVKHFVMPKTQRARHGDMPQWYYAGDVFWQTQQTVYLSGVAAPSYAGSM